jgi:hypothetical protein
LVPQYPHLSLNADGTVFDHQLLMVGRNHSNLEMRRPAYFLPWLDLLRVLVEGIQYRREYQITGSVWPCSSGGRAVAMEGGGRFAVPGVPFLRLSSEEACVFFGESPPPQTGGKTRAVIRLRGSFPCTEFRLQSCREKARKTMKE